MTCHDMKRLLDLEGRGDISALERQALDSHLEGCTRCAEAAKVARLSSALLGALREEIPPSPTFYARLRARMATDGGNQTDTTLFQVWDFARRLSNFTTVKRPCFLRTTVSRFPLLIIQIALAIKFHLPLKMAM